jgi:hypothetical protein
MPRMKLWLLMYIFSFLLFIIKLVKHEKYQI